MKATGIWTFSCTGNALLSLTWTSRSPTGMSSTSTGYSLEGDPHNMLDLGGEIELTLSEDGKNMGKYVFTADTTVFIKAGLFHCPLVFKKVTKPVIFYDYVSRLAYARK